MSLLPLFNNTQPTLSSPNRFFLNKNLKSNILFGFFTILIICSITINLYHFINCYLEDDLEYLIIDNNNNNSNNNNNNNNDSNNKEILYNNNNSTQIFLPDVSYPKLKDLIIVTGHAIYLGGGNNHEIRNEEENEENWILEDYQKGNGQVKAFINHVKKGIELLKENDESLLIFSGGQTRPSAGPRSEAQSYYILAQSLNLNLSSTINSTTSLNTRIITEEYARDSYENLLFSICRFNEYTNSYPRNITVIGFQFKKKRFSELHRFALKFPLDRFNYIGIDPDNTSPLGRFVGESVNSLGPFKQDLYGCHGKLLDKKLTRNPYRRSHPYQISCPELSPLLNYCPEDRIQLYPDRLPWEY